MKKYLLIGVSAFVLGAGSMAYVSQHAHGRGRAPAPRPTGCSSLFGDVLDTVERQYVTAGGRHEADPGGDRRHADLARSALRLPRPRELRRHARPDARRVRRPGHRGHQRGRRGQGDLADGRHARPPRAGVKAGDYITAVNGESVLGLSVNDAVKQMRGKPGETVTLTIAREKSDPFDVKLVREIIKPKSATAKHGRRLRLSAHLRLQREDHRRGRRRPSTSCRPRTRT